MYHDQRQVHNMNNFYKSMTWNLFHISVHGLWINRTRHVSIVYCSSFIWICLISTDSIGLVDSILCVELPQWYNDLGRNKANLRDLIAATDLVILLKFDPILRFFSPYDLKIWWMTSKNNRTTLLYYIKLGASFQSHGLIQTGVTVRKRSIRDKIGDFFYPCDLATWQMTLKNNRAPLLCYFKLCASCHGHQKRR